MTSTPATGRVTPKQKRSVRSERQILSAAVNLLTTEGFSEFTMSSVSDESGVSIGGVYRRFPNREALLRQVKDEVMNDLEAVVDERLAAEPADLAQILAAFTGVLSAEYSARSRLFAFIFVHSADDGVMRRRGFDFHNRMKQMLRSAVHRCPDLCADGLDATVDIVYELIMQSLLMRVTTSGSVDAGEPTYDGRPDSPTYATELARAAHLYLIERCGRRPVDAPPPGERA
jgi:AcrR family transcriptional regulator